MGQDEYCYCEKLWDRVIIIVTNYGAGVLLLLQEYSRGLDDDDDDDTCRVSKKCIDALLDPTAASVPPYVNETDNASSFG